MNRPASSRITLRIPVQLHRHLARLAGKKGVRVADVARACLLDGLEQLEGRRVRDVDAPLQWEHLTRKVEHLLRTSNPTGYRTALIRRLAGLSVERWEMIDHWMEERLTKAQVSAAIAAKESLVYFRLPAKILPALTVLAQRVKHRLYVRDLRQKQSLGSGATERTLANARDER